MPAKGDEIITAYKRYKDNRAPHESRWQRHAPFMSPWSYGIMGEEPDGAPTQQQVYDNTGIYANDVLANFITDSIINPSEKYISYKHPDPDLAEDDEVKEWCEEATDRVLAAVTRSNFYTEAPITISTNTGFGTGCMFRGERLREAWERDARPGFRGFRFQAHKIGRFYIGESANNEVTINYVDFPYTAGQIAERWKNIPDKVAECIRNNKLDQRFTIVFAVYPRRGEDRRYASGKNGMPYAACYVELEEKFVLEEGGFERNPFVDPRWDIIPGEVYGRCPGDIAFNTILTVNAATQLDHESWALDARPPTWMRNDSELGTVNLVPGSFMSVRVPPGMRLQDSFHHYTSGALHQVNEIREQNAKQEILKAYHVLQITEAMSTPKRDETAYQFSQRLSLMFRVLGPIYGRFVGEFMKPTFDGIFEDLFRRGELSPPPQAVIDYAEQRGEDKVDITMEFHNPLSRAQKTVEIESLNFALADLSVLIDMEMKIEGHSQAFDWLDRDAAAKKIFDVRGVSASIINNDKQVEAIRNARQQAQQQANQQEQTIAATEAIKNVTPALTAMNGNGAA